LAIVSFILALVSFHAFQLYRPWRGKGYYKEFETIVKGWGAVVGIVLFLLFCLKLSDRFSRIILLSWFFLTPFFLFLLHYGARSVLRRLRAKGKNMRSAVIVGAGDIAKKLNEQIERTPWAGIKVKGFFANGENTFSPAENVSPFLGPISNLKDYLENNGADYVYITLPMREEKKIYEILLGCRTLGSQIYIILDIYGYSLFNARMETLGDFALLNFNPDSTAKRYFDVLFSAFILSLTLPLTLLVSLFIKLEDGGPVLYGHTRIARAGNRFECLKFRTMYPDAAEKLKGILASDPDAKKEWERSFKLKNDPRITKVGKFLRKTSLDELPQFINVLKGEMSVVGARPVVQEELHDYYKENRGLYCSIKPGITGPWQIGVRSDTEDYDERVELDKWYILNNGFWVDMKIIFKTAWCMIKRKGAY